MDDEAWTQKIVASREQKDRFFKESPDSPVPPGERAGFSGLTYYDVDVRYRLVLELDEEDPQTFSIPRSAGDEVEYTQVGTFALDLPEGRGRIAAYRTEGGGDDLFLMFRDATSGKETYGAGRYLEAKPLKSGRWYVDFNRAYHPFCVYNDAYTCPLPPPQNWLQFPVYAGERL